MTNSKELFRDLVNKITLEVSKEERESIVYYLLYHTMQLSHTDIMSEKQIVVSDVQFDVVVNRLNKHEPIQYILGECEFCGRTFNVSPAVLIPRPETELLISHLRSKLKQASSILDIGTGSGCIAITLALESEHASVYALDVSEEALIIARENAARLGARVTFFQMDILDQQPSLSQLDAVVSNPPYVLESESVTMQRNVLEFEPKVALFVPEDDPLLFYRAIARRSKAMLKKGGTLAFEINELMGQQVLEMLAAEGYSERLLLQDIDRKDRMVFAKWTP